jgi:osmoprotectant transport system permease protein
MIADAFWSSLVDAWSRSQDRFWEQGFVFLSLALRAVGVALLAGIPVGILLARLPRLSSPIIATLALLQTLPSLALVGLLLPWLGIGQTAAVFVAVVYSLFPVVLNTCVGITQVPASIRDAARGMGMTSSQLLWRVELPLALPVILAGIRTGAVYAIGIVTVCALVGAGGLGDFIVTGLTRGDDGLVLLGALPILAITLVMFWGLGGVAALARRNSGLGLAVGGGLIVALAVYAAAEPLVRVRRTDVVIGSKNFTEGYILSEIFRQMLDAHTQLHVKMVPNLGSNLAYKSLKASRIDLYPEYTGNLLTGRDALNNPQVPGDVPDVTAFVRQRMKQEHDMVLLELFGFNNTYALCLPRKLADQHGLERVSDLVRTPELRVIVDLEFMDRPDGWKGLVETYGLRFDEPPAQVSPDLLYRALESDSADVVCGFATDWQIDALDLLVLQDDRHYFPNYHGAPLVRGRVLQRHPEIADVLNRLGGQIDDATMRRLNARVAKDKRLESDVVREFLLVRELVLER